MLAVVLGNIAPMGVRQGSREVKGPGNIASLFLSQGCIFRGLYHRLRDTDLRGHTLVSLLHLEIPGLEEQTCH